MSTNKAKVAIALVLLVFSPAVVFADAGKLAFEQGKTLVSQGDFEGAMQAFATAARADRTNAEYMQNYSLVRQVIMIQNALETEQDSQRWEYYARALHSYYISEKLYDQALELDGRIH